MKRLLPVLLMASGISLAAIAQDQAAPANQPRQRGEIGRAPRGPAGQMGQRGQMGAQTALDRIMNGGDIEGGMLLRLLDNPRIAQQIQLTDDQRKAIEDAVKDLNDELEAIRPKLDEALKVQTELLRELKPDQDKLLAAVDDAWKLRTDVAKIQTRKLLVLRSLLTDDQAERARNMADGFRNRFGGQNQPGAQGQGGGDRGQRQGDGDRGQWQRPQGGGQAPAGGAQGDRPQRGQWQQRQDGGQAPAGGGRQGGRRGGARGGRGGGGQGGNAPGANN
jgi:hypothetical protein